MYTVSSEQGYTTTRSAVRQPLDGSPASGWLLLFIAAEQTLFFLSEDFWREAVWIELMPAGSGVLLGKALKGILILGGNLSEADDRSRRMI